MNMSTACQLIFSMCYTAIDNDAKQIRTLEYFVTFLCLKKTSGNQPKNYIKSNLILVSSVLITFSLSKFALKARGHFKSMQLTTSQMHVSSMKTIKRVLRAINPYYIRK